MKSVFLTSVLLFGLASCTVMTTFTYTRMAAKYYDDGDYSNAIQYYMKAVANNDKRAETFYWLAMSFYRHGDLEEAMLALERSLERDPADVTIIERLAAVNLDLGNLDRAGFYGRMAIRLDSAYVEGYNTLGHVFFESGNLDSAESYFNHTLTLSKRLRKESMVSKGFRSYAELQAEASNGLGEICIARGWYFPALSYLTTANALAPNWETPWLNKGKTYEALGNVKAAEISYQRTIDLDPENTTAYKHLARIYRSLGRDNEAMTLYKRAMKVDTADVESCYGLAELYEIKGDNKSAADTYDKAVDRSPDDPVAYDRAARANMLINNCDLAIEYLTELVQLQPGKGGAYNSLGEAYRTVGDTAAAVQAFKNAIAVDSLYTVPLRNLGAIVMAQGKESVGLQYFFRAARLGDSKAAEFLRSRGLGWE